MGDKNPNKPKKKKKPVEKIDLKLAAVEEPVFVKHGKKKI
jgi:hypothetical protein